MESFAESCQMIDGTGTDARSPAGLGSLRLRRTLFAVLLAVATVRCSSSRRALRVSDCVIPDVGVARCGDYQVWEDRAARSGRRIRIHYVLLPPLDHEPAADPIFIIAGGPGQAATDLIDAVATEYAPLRRRRSLVFVDQRGTGGSNPLRCDPYPANDPRRYLGPPPNREQIIACRDSLTTRANLSHYTTTDAADDLDDLRAALGFRQINVDGGSYGTRVALQYIRRHGAAVRSAVLRAVSPFDYAIPLHFARAGQDALDAVLTECEKNEACEANYPAVRKKLDAVMSNLQRQPVEVSISDPENGRPMAVTLTRSIFVSRLHLLLFSSKLAAQIPSLIDAAYRGDYKPFAQLAAAFGGAISQSIYFGMQLSVVCTEDVPFISDSATAQETRGTFLGDERIRQAIAYCQDWPRGALPDDWIEPVHASTPVLAISGARDPATPPGFAAQALRDLPNARHFIIANGSHIEGSDCVTGLVKAFIDDPSSSLDAACLSAPRPLDFVDSAKP
jgi:pimeloyl-ACP methyl ester carboxylesterase